MNYYQLEPEVAGGWGENTITDSSVNPPHPPLVTRLHYEFSGWLGDCIVESFPCFVITEKVSVAIEAESLTGCEIAEVEVTLSDEFRELFPDRRMPKWRWLKISGTPATDDIATTKESILVVSERALSIFRNYGLKYCDIDPFEG